MRFAPDPDPPECDDPTHAWDCGCGADPDRAYERRVEAER